MQIYVYADIYKYTYTQICERLVCSCLSICPFIYVISNYFCNTMMLYCHETHFIFHQSLWKWWSEIIYPVLVNGLGFLFLLQQNERIAWQIHIHYYNRCTAVILVWSCLIFVLIKKNILSYDKVWNEKSWRISFLFCKGSCSDWKYVWPPNLTSFCENSCKVQECFGTYDFVWDLCKSEDIYF